MAKKTTKLFPKDTLFLSVAIPPSDELFHTALITARRDERASLHKIEYTSMEQLMEGLAACATRLAEVEARPPVESPASESAPDDPDDSADGAATEEVDLDIAFFDPAESGETTKGPGATQESLF